MSDDVQGTHHELRSDDLKRWIELRRSSLDGNSSEFARGYESALDDLEKRVTEHDRKLGEMLWFAGNNLQIKGEGSPEHKAGTQLKRAADMLGYPTTGDNDE